MSINELILPGGRLLEQRDRMGTDQQDPWRFLCETKRRDVPVPKIGHHWYNIKDDQKFVNFRLQARESVIGSRYWLQLAENWSACIVTLPAIEDLEIAIGRLERSYRLTAKMSSQSIN